MYFTTFQVAKALGVSPPTVVNWINAGLLQAHRTPGGHRRIRREDVVVFAREHAYPLDVEHLGGAPNGDEPAAETLARRVLVVDDDVDFARMVQDYLSLKAGFEVEIAESGFAAGFAVARFRPSVVLLDIQMPDLDGFEVLRRMRENPETREIPVVACTAYDNPDWEDRARREAFIAFVRKSTRLERLLDILDAAVHGRDIPA